MSVVEEVEDPRWSIREKCFDCIRGPNLIKTIVILGCIGVVLQQIIASIQKMIDIPITTYTHFDFNKTLDYPSITLCRDPPYKYDTLDYYNLSGHPGFQEEWRKFDFENNDLDEVWDNITFNADDIFVQYGLHKLPSNVDLTPVMGFEMGRCYTMSPKSGVKHVSQAEGYSMTMRHTARDLETTVSIDPPGYRVYIHYTREPFTEVKVYNGGMVEYLYLNVGEMLRVKVTVDEYKMISRSDAPCTSRRNYSANECTTRYIWDLVTKDVGCSGPWMDSPLPRCSNFTTIRSLIIKYRDIYRDHTYSSCPRICRSLLYNGYVTDRQKHYFWDSKTKVWSTTIGAAALETHLHVNFNSMMVSVYEERYNYDWNLFVSDLGGSIGFLLGLSVIGLMQIVGKTWRYFIKPLIKCDKKSSSVSITSAATADVKTIRQDYMNTWNDKNTAVNKT
ncbi:degenerin-like protein asic-1 [Spodoptera frugiperda]|uniref:Degenerin-like protein asic-1 n=1 Tax=Spodoptera frugiperda TaxID=7108 RepID=A0A9R0EK02_SPOFR|nr:degenerin-like protein asic-1 [Spodoptera frugiperda]